jgi:hypothetical protein
MAFRLRHDHPMAECRIWIPLLSAATGFACGAVPVLLLSVLFGILGANIKAADVPAAAVWFGTYGARRRAAPETADDD